VNGIYVVQTPQVMAVLYEGAPYSTYRLIFTDGRPHPDPKKLDPSFWGHSIGRWDGDTLVVDVVGLTEDSWVGGGGAVGRNMYTSVHSDQLHVVERWKREADVLTSEVTVEDPVAFTKPWVIAPRRVRHAGPDDVMYEATCTPTAEHLVAPRADDPDFKTRCGYRCEDDTPSPQLAETPTSNVSGTWAVTTRFQNRQTTEQWKLQQKGNAVTGTARGDRELPVVGSIEGNFLRVSIKDGDKEYKIRATSDANGLDGSITIGVGEQYLWQAKRAKAE